MLGKNAKLKRQQFAESVLKRVQDAGETAQLEYDPDSFAIVGPKDHVLHLSSVFKATQDPEYDREAMTQNLVRMWFRQRDILPEHYDEVRADLLICVSARYRYELQINQGAVKSIVPTGLLGDHIATSIVYDLPEALRQVNEVDLKTWEVSFEEALNDAKDNLEELIGLARFDVLRPGLFSANVDENYNSSLLLLPELLKELDVKGDLVAMVPNRRTLLLTGTEDSEGLVELAKVARAEIKQPWSRSGFALRLSGYEWSDYLPEPSHPAYGAFAKLRQWTFSMAYKTQTSLLRTQYGDELFVVQYLPVSRTNAGEILSVCTWPATDPSLLPKTDLIAFCSPKANMPLIKCVSWDEAVEHVGDLMTPTEHYPKRIKVDQFPTADQLSAMKGHRLQA